MTSIFFLTIESGKKLSENLQQGFSRHIQTSDHEVRCGFGCGNESSPGVGA
jgi:hypothetical protein